MWEAGPAHHPVCTPLLELEFLEDVLGSPRVFLILASLAAWLGPERGRLLGSCSGALPLSWGRIALRQVAGWKGSFSRHVESPAGRTGGCSGAGLDKLGVRPLDPPGEDVPGRHWGESSPWGVPICPLWVGGQVRVPVGSEPCSLPSSQAQMLSRLGAQASSLSRTLAPPYNLASKDTPSTCQPCL